MSKTKLYRIDTKGSDKPRVIEAVSSMAALKQAAAGMFTASLIRSPVETAGLLALPGVVLEKVGEVAPEPQGGALPEAAAIVEAAGILIADAGEPLTADALFAKMIALPEGGMPDTPEARAAFDSAVGDAATAGTLTIAEPSKGGGKK